MPTLTIDFTAPQAARIAAAYGKELGLVDDTDPENPVPRDANMAEVKHKVIQQIKGVVFRQERAALVAAVAVDELEPT